MKLTKTIVFFITVTLFTATSYTVANAAVDCSNPKGFHAKMTCKLKGINPDPNAESPKKKGDGFWDKLKLKNIGGKPVDNS
jgi:hypothetical protein